MPRHGKSSKPAKPVREGRIVLVDEAPLRKRAATEFKRTMTKLEKSRAEWRRFEAEDRPAFSRWLASTFGALLTEIRENARLIDEQGALVEEVEMEMLWGSQRSPQKAYAAVMKRREHPEAEDDLDSPDPKANGPDPATGTHPDEAGFEDDDEFDPFGEMGGGIPEEVRREMFHDFVRTIFGLNPKQLPKATYDAMFEKFEAEMFPGGRARNASFAPGAPEQRSSGPHDARIKEIYRILVRRLHPDTRADRDAQVSAMWHDVQEAYASRDLDRLEALLAMTEMKGGRNGGKATVGQMQDAVRELKRALRAIQRTIQEGKRDPAWSFTQLRDLAPLEKSIRREMEMDLAQQRRVLQEQKRMLDDWSRPKKPASKAEKQGAQAANRAPKRPRSKPASSGRFQEEFFPF